LACFLQVFPKAPNASEASEADEADEHPQDGVSEIDVYMVR